jgi:hypothetical protein
MFSAILTILLTLTCIVAVLAVAADEHRLTRKRNKQLMRNGYASGPKKASELLPLPKELTKEEKEVLRLANDHAVAMLEVVNAAEKAALIKAGRIRKPQNSQIEVTDRITAKFDGASRIVEITDDPDKPRRDWNDSHSSYEYKSRDYHPYRSGYDSERHLSFNKNQVIALRDWLNSLTFDPIEDDLPQPFDFSLVPQNKQ